MNKQRIKRISLSDKALVIYLLILIFLMLLIIPKEVMQRHSIVGNVLASVRIIEVNAPEFAQNMSNSTINQSASFFFDVNCSDADGDTITYYDNFTGFEINDTNGIINKTASGNDTLVFAQSFVANNTIEIRCSDSLQNTSSIFILEITDVNEAPVLESIGPQISTEDELFTLDVDATDPDGNSLTFQDSTTIFAINSLTGVINFTPSSGHVGNHTINISVFDSNLYDWEVISFRVVEGPFCGDGSCGSTETCTSCSSDCGACSSSSSGDESTAESGEGGESSAAASAEASATSARAPFYRCDERWECSDWGVCSLEGLRTRTCKDINKCGSKQKKPVETTECVYQPTCEDGILNGGETGIDCGGPCRPCMVSSCFDEIQNQNETGIDCGGQCKACEVKVFAKLPTLEIPAKILELSRNFPWILVLMVAALLTLTVAGDQIYIRRITRKEFEEYKESRLKYRKIRKKIYMFSLSMLVMSMIFSSYIYWFSNDSDKMIRHSWIPILLILLTPVGVSMVIRKYTFYEYEKKRKEQRLKETHKHELLQLIKVENETLSDLELSVKDKIYGMAAKHRFDQFPSLYSEINPIYGILSNLEKKRGNRTELLRLPSKILYNLLTVIESKAMAKASKEYPEFMSILKRLKYLEDNKDLDTTDKESELLDGVEEISRPHMRTVILSDKNLIALYNALVEIYSYYTEKQQKMADNDREIMEIEREFTDKLKEISKKGAIMEPMQKDPDFAAMYNSMVDLFNHYIKKMELSRSLKDL